MFASNGRGYKGGAVNLETNAATLLTGKQYERPLSNFLESAADQGIALDTDEQVDGELVKDLNHQYLGG